MELRAGAPRAALSAGVRGAEIPWRRNARLASNKVAFQSTARAHASMEDESAREEALRRIAKARDTGRLDLTGLGLRSVPSEAYDLPDLVEFQASNNNLYELSEDIGKLTKLERLGLAGNRLRTLPRSIGALTSLRGLWAHGNCLKSLPDELCACVSLRNLAVAGNRLRELPSGMSALTSLEELSAPGNQLRRLPDFGAMPLLREIDVHGNHIEALPDDVRGLRALETFSLQGNSLRAIPKSLTTLRRLRALNLAENNIRELPSEISDMTMLTSLWLYSNELAGLPGSMRKLPSLRQLWVEGNKELGPSLNTFIDAMNGHKTLQTFGIDQFQLAHVTNSAAFVTISEIPENAPVGYFKLVRWHGSSAPEKKNAPVLIVSFGSAPGVPNWGGLLKKLAKNISAGDSYDVLYVCDVERSWYMSNEMSVDQDAEFERWSEHLRKVCAGYKRVLYIGDSMGASASLMFAEHATRVLSFCPQVDLYLSSIRLSRSKVWFQRFKKCLLSGLEKSSATVDVHTGSWEHDKYQVSLLPSSEMKHIVHPVDSHRLALALDDEEKLLPIIKKAYDAELAIARGEAPTEKTRAQSPLDSFAPWQTIGLR